MRDCKECKYADIIRVGHLDFDIPDCQLDIPEWIKCRNNDYSRFVQREETEGKDNE